jgi:hypothetical protein
VRLSRRPAAASSTPAPEVDVLVCLWAAHARFSVSEHMSRPAAHSHRLESKPRSSASSEAGIRRADKTPARLSNIQDFWWELRESIYRVRLALVKGESDGTGQEDLLKKNKRAEADR